MCVLLLPAKLFCFFLAHSTFYFSILDFFTYFKYSLFTFIILYFALHLFTLCLSFGFYAWCFHWNVRQRLCSWWLLFRSLLCFLLLLLLLLSNCSCWCVLCSMSTLHWTLRLTGDWRLSTVFFNKPNRSVFVCSFCNLNRFCGQCCCTIQQKLVNGACAGICLQMLYISLLTYFYRQSEFLALSYQIKFNILILNYV